MTVSGHCASVDGLSMAYLEGGHGDPVVFLPDSGPGSYRYAEHRHYLDGLLATLGVTGRVVLVGHDWGGVLAVDWARRHPGAVRGLAYLETLVAPVPATGPNAPDPAFFGPLRSPEGERLVLEENVFVEQVLPAGTQRQLAPDEMDAYRRPYLTWAREIPLDGSPADVHDVVSVPGLHFLPEDSPTAIAEALGDWMSTLD